MAGLSTELLHVSELRHATIRPLRTRSGSRCYVDDDRAREHSTRPGRQCPRSSRVSTERVIVDEAREPPVPRRASGPPLRVVDPGRVGGGRKERRGAPTSSTRECVVHDQPSTGSQRETPTGFFSVGYARRPGASGRSTKPSPKSEMLRSLARTVRSYGQGRGFRRPEARVAAWRRLVSRGDATSSLVDWRP